VASFDPTEPRRSTASYASVPAATLDVAFATLFGTARLRRLSPLVEPSDNAAYSCACNPTSGVLLAA
jgi:hypothetical protein